MSCVTHPLHCVRSVHDTGAPVVSGCLLLHLLQRHLQVWRLEWGFGIVDGLCLWWCGVVVVRAAVIRPCNTRRCGQHPIHSADGACHDWRAVVCQVAIPSTVVPFCTFACRPLWIRHVSGPLNSPTPLCGRTGSCTPLLARSDAVDVVVGCVFACTRLCSRAGWHVPEWAVVLHALLLLHAPKPGPSCMFRVKCIRA